MTMTLNEAIRSHEKKAKRGGKHADDHHALVGWLVELRDRRLREKRCRPEALVGNVTDVASGLRHVDGGMTADKLADLIMTVAKERDTALYWENHFKSQLRYVETYLKMAMGAIEGGLKRCAGALDGSGGTPLGNFVNIPKPRSGGQGVGRKP
jgi:hypothetical protein